MLYALLIYEDETVYGPNKEGPAMDAIRPRHIALVRELGAKRIGGSGLKSVKLATTIRTDNGRQTVHDGPFAETKEQLGGFYLIDVADLDEALAIARRVPLTAHGAIEVRPVIPPPPGGYEAQ
ncbi:hypothetical protein GCM10011611_01100 [Aliidongia dinghuensis]|uniref:YCII-related domain-containing protein n=1 Tax=Aliidongia dinghuensis TaxID=1867774 RepID=A0A8J2YP20_9PROT|nr:YciI family protein [Aliidongia dinghuensis]GGE99307.1 hypothetical protein GCM10011611_01100 [Aliidongia dinghuensis]